VSRGQVSSTSRACRGDCRRSREVAFLLSPIEGLGKKLADTQTADSPTDHVAHNDRLRQPRSSSRGAQRSLCLAPKRGTAASFRGIASKRSPTIVRASTFIAGGGSRIMSTKRKAPGGGAAGTNGVPGSKRKVRFQKKEEGETQTTRVQSSQQRDRPVPQPSLLLCYCAAAPPIVGYKCCFLSPNIQLPLPLAYVGRLRAPESVSSSVIPPMVNRWIGFSPPAFCGAKINCYVASNIPPRDNFACDRPRLRGDNCRWSTLDAKCQEDGNTGVCPYSPISEHAHRPWTAGVSSHRTWAVDSTTYIQ